MNSYTSEEMDAWKKYEIGKPCGKHPNSLIKKGRYGNWCGNKTFTGGWCSGEWPSDEFITNYRKNYVQH